MNCQGQGMPGPGNACLAKKPSPDHSSTFPEKACSIFQGTETKLSSDWAVEREGKAAADPRSQLRGHRLSPLLCNMTELSNVPARDLDRFIENHLMVDTPFRKQVRAAIHIISSFLKEKCFQGTWTPVRVSKVVKGGSSGKGTALRGQSDADLVVFINNLRSFKEQFEHRGEFIEEIRRQLVACQREETFDVEFEIQRFQYPRALSFTLRSPWYHKGVEFDVLPAFDVLGQWNGHRPNPQIYARLIQECEDLGKWGEFSPCFTELQRAFLRDRPAKLKSLIRLVKHWFQKCKKKSRGPLPPQYALELLTVYAWEQGSGSPYFNTAEGFRTVLELVLDHEKLCIYWTKYYDFKNAVIKRCLTRMLNKRRPVILDPADPTGNVAGRDRFAWLQLATEAHTWLSYLCFKKWDGFLVASWDVPPEVDSASDSEEEDSGLTCGCLQTESSQGFRTYQEVGLPWTMDSPRVTSSHRVASPPWGISTARVESTSQDDEDWTCVIL
ncbi:2'-5'-oligoadenylate synthase 1-like [Erinaceus europaeus]|uniref:2'-5' oligoadenylate synthase n=1 Tax=Erinaceus europaeus TaxID=9365 RepID=A0A1S3WIA1_ERIEU|nr:2'-5'-oligoadenylate synthase 1-like [Erinaceus europaeus]